MKLFRTKYWEVNLMKDQAYLGRSVIKLKRKDCGDLADLTKEEIIDFLEVVRKFESAIRKAFGTTMFNWSCLMNDVYKSRNPKPHVHWHVRPRYKNSVKFEGIDFEDKEFAHHYDNKKHRDVDEKMLRKIAKKIKAMLERK